MERDAGEAGTGPAGTGEAGTGDAGADARELHVVVGAGTIGGGIALALAGQGRRVRVVSRSGSGPAHVERVAADAADASMMAELTAGAAAVYNCANPPYHRWPQLWPPIAAALLGAAEQNGAVLVTVSNLYGYGPARQSLGVPGYDAEHPMTEATPLAASGRKGRVRAQMWRDALAAHQAGRVRATEVRASDYVGPGASSVLGDRVVPRVLGGKAVSVLGSPDRPHTWTFTGDVVTLAVLAGREPRAWGQAWHVPSGEPRTQREAIDDLARAAGVRPVPVRPVPRAVLRAAGLVSPLMRELTETGYQFSQDFVLDSSAARQAFGLSPTPWEQVLRDVIASYRAASQAAQSS
jgi:nucleoside-diphosphate-sugar epimerase